MGSCLINVFNDGSSFPNSHPLCRAGFIAALALMRVGMSVSMCVWLSKGEGRQQAGENGLRLHGDFSWGITASGN
jgi:hypothetical protein